PAFTVAFPVQTPSSPLYTVAVYAPGFMFASVNAPLLASTAVQYCAVALAKPTMYSCSPSMPLMPAAETAPRAETQPVKFNDDIQSKLGIAGVQPVVKRSAYGPCSPVRTASVWLWPEFM